jgi:crotonobetainyl-CoA:carnitine CoA-transferase CaiB-like acyl-CoA transferase
MSGAALEGIRVVDLSSSVAGQYCGRLLADYGAQVELLERSDAPSQARAESLSGDGLPEGESFVHFHLNRGKAVRAVSPDRAAEERAKALSDADVVLVDERTAALFGEVPAREGRIICSVTPFGADAPDVGAQVGNELVYQALSGTMYLNGDADRAPLYGLGNRASYAAGTTGYIQILSCLWAGRTEAFIDVAIAEVATSMDFNCITQFSYSGFVERRGDKTVPRSTIRCSDGWVTLFLRDHRWPRAMEAFGLGWLTSDPRFSTEKDRLAHWDAFEAVLTAEFAHWEANEVVRVGQSVDGVVAKAKSIEELLVEPHLVGRGFWSGAPQPFAGHALVPLGPVFPEPRPWAGAENGAVDARSTRGAWPGPGLDGVGPLAGLRVLECTTAWSGPMASHILALLGADVIKVEAPRRIDDWRGNPQGSHWGRYPDGVHGDEPFNRNGHFNTQNTDKRDICLDAKDAVGAHVMGDLMAASDVVITNFRAHWLARVGFDDAFFAERNPRAIAVEMTAYGSGGELSNHAALGPSLEMMSGMGGLIGYGDGRPISTGPAYLDPIGALNGAAAALTALMIRERQGVGGYVEVCQREAAMNWIADEFYRVQAGHRPSVGNGRADTGNRVPLSAPHAAYPTSGDDQWIAIGVDTDAQFERLRSMIDDPRLFDTEFDTALGRKASEDLLDEVIGEWAGGQDKHSLAERLCEIGVPAAPVMDSADLFGSPYLHRRGLVREMDHPACGRHLYQTLPLHIREYDLRPRVHAPLLGQDTVAVLTALGVAPEAVEDLRERSVITDRPLARTR